jgi:hypothetical protein
MGFASTYLETSTLFPELIKEAPDEETNIIAVVPAFDEPDLTKLLDSLSLCYKPECKAEVIIVVNSPLDANPESRENNKKSISDIEAWEKRNPDSFFRLFIIDKTNCPVKGWGVGLARKTGMDEAVRRFNNLNNPEGVILNLDADCIVAENYLTAIFSEFVLRKDRSACSIYFEHPLSGDEFHENIYCSIAQYELHLRYFYQGLRFSGFPFAYHTIGSAIAVKALPYIKAGGMNRRQAGEDFYFVQKLLPAGGYFNLNTTAVYPSPRVSFRVPFGTGATVSRILGKNKGILPSYNIESFKELFSFFKMIYEFYYSKPDEVPELHASLPNGIQHYLSREEWISKVLEIKANTSSLQSFKKRFFTWFNMFKIVKYLNCTNDGIYEKKPVTESSLELLNVIGISCESNDPFDILLLYRNLEKSC